MVPHVLKKTMISGRPRIVVDRPLQGALESKPRAGEEAGFGPDFFAASGEDLESSQESFSERMVSEMIFGLIRLSF